MVRIAKIVVLKGDGIGPEVVEQGLRVLRTVGEIRKLHFSLDEELIGGIAIDKTGNPLPDATIKAVKKADAVLLGAVGGPKWTDPAVRPEQGLLALRREMGVFANLRPVSLISDSLIPSSPLGADIVRGTDILFVRELTGGVYFGKKQEETEGKAYDTMEYTVEEVTRVTRIAARLALKRRKKITSVDKANVLATSRLWRRVVEKVLKEEFPEVTLDHMLVDTAAMKIVCRPTEFDVILTENLFGDILTDEGAVLPGSIGVLPSASLGSSTNGLYEPIHGSAPDIAGKGIANPIGTILSIALLLEHSLNLPWEAQCIRLAVRDALDQGHRTADMVAGSEKFSTTSEITDIIVQNLKEKLHVRPMTLCEKILCHHAVGLSKPEVVPDQMLCVQVDWTLASELTWVGMEKTYDQMGRPSVWRNDRFWLAVDHTVDPSNYDQPKPRALIAASEKFAKEANVENYLPANQSILHTDFYRERAQPGMLVVGADSHSCSAGGLGTFAIGLGAADVVVPLVTGETWLRVPPTVKIEYTGVPKFGIGGKDVILHTMGKLKRNTVAFERAVEYTGNLSALSCDARFAISNMTAEFGGIVGVFAADEITSAYVAKRATAKHKNNPIYFRADADAHYEATYQIPLDEIDSLVALFPSPDNVVPVTEVVGKKLDGVFIGACTTAEEDLILAALVLDQGLKKGFTPAKTGGKRKVTPGSVSIVAKLRRLGLIEVYEKAGFEIGAPGCSYCLGVAADKAGEGEVWLSSQNRNFENRMGKGSIANLASAACVAASSFTMTVQDPRPLLDAIDKVKYQEMLEIWIAKGEAFEISEPHPTLVVSEGDASAKEDKALSMQQVVEGKVQRFGDNIDTDAIIPAEFMPGKNDEDLGTHAFQYVRPSFVEKVKEGFNIVVAGGGFGCGSSREEAPRALKGSGVLAVIAKSYAFIYGRNQPNMSLLGFTITDDKFYELAQEGVSVKVDVPKRTVTVADIFNIFYLMSSLSSSCLKYKILRKT
eukprot:Phypoly_transcript_01536.p1 GENE.Phypoly_transcript_01536~~Phypoly_transcript_01536.p1  ORF type:complete len:1000 (+),score=173.08 Phypoly_transcript_01536:90-3089(+)